MTPGRLKQIEDNLGAAFWIGGPTAAFARDSLELIAALKDAWEALDQVSSDDRMSEAQITAAITEAQKERDEARASLEWQAAMTKALSESQERLVQEVKEARAEVELLRAEVRKQVFSSRVVFDREVVERAQDALEAALKEGK